MSVRVFTSLILAACVFVTARRPDDEQQQHLTAAASALVDLFGENSRQVQALNNRPVQISAKQGRAAIPARRWVLLPPHATGHIVWNLRTGRR